MSLSGFLKAPCAAMLAMSIFALTGTAGQAQSATTSFVDEGAKIDIKGMGDFTLSFPKLKHGEDQKEAAPIEKKISGNHADLKYADGTSLAMDLQPDGDLAMSFNGIPADLKFFQMVVLIGPQYSDGGLWKVDSDSAKPFPKEKPPKPFLFQGHARTFSFSDASGHTLSLSLPPYSYQQLADNREWNWNIFQWSVLVPCHVDMTKFVLSMKASSPEPGQAAQFLIDKFGQAVAKEFPEKVKDEAELKADAQSESAYYANLKPLELDSFGGLPGSRAKFGLKSTGFFHVERKGAKWLLADPEGNVFFHLGVCSFGYNEDYTYVKDRKDIFEWLPALNDEYAAAWHPDKYWHDDTMSFYITNLIRKYGTSFERDRHLRTMVDRVRRMGFNSIGAFSGSPVFKAAHIPYVSSLPLEIWSFAPDLPGIRGVFDPFEEANVSKMDRLFAKQVAPSAEEPLLIGYFLANEQGFEDIARAAPQLPGKHAAKRKLVEMLKESYGDIAAFNSAWGLDAKDFDSLLDKGLAVTTQKAFDDMRRYSEIFLESYYSLISSTFRKYDKNHLLIGNRWQPGTANSEMLCRIAGKYMDVISVNYYTVGVDADFMKRIYDWSGEKPQIWSEFFYTSSAESNVGGHGGDILADGIGDGVIELIQPPAQIIGADLHDDQGGAQLQRVGGKALAHIGGDIAADSAVHEDFAGAAKIGL